MCVCVGAQRAFVWAHLAQWLAARDARSGGIGLQPPCAFREAMFAAGERLRPVLDIPPECSTGEIACLSSEKFVLI